MRRRRLGLILLVLACAARLSAAEPERVDLFVSGEGGYGRYRIPALVMSHKGTLLAFSEGRVKAAGLTGDIDLVLRRSFDQGNSWQPMQVVSNDGPHTLGNPCPVIDKSTGVIWLLFTRSPGHFTEKQIVSGDADETTSVFVTKSEDDGKTWSKPHEITARIKLKNWTWYGTGPGNGIQLSNGTLFIPSYHAEAGSMIYRCHSVFSDDHGATWSLGGILSDHTTEPAVVQRANGCLVMNARSINQQGYRAVAVSCDGGKNWTDIKLDPTLTCISCQGSLIGFSNAKAEDKSRWLFSNPPGPGRRNLTVRVSYDEGATWPHAKVLDTGTTEYSNLLRLPDGRAAILYERSSGNVYKVVISFSRLSLDWLTDGKDHGPTKKP